MARFLSVGSAIDKSRLSSDTPWIILLDVNVTDPNTREVVETLRIAKNNENIVFGTDADGNPIVYQAGNFDITIEQRQNQAQTVSISARDEMNYIQSRMEAMAGGVFSTVIVTVVNTARLDKPAEVQNEFEVIGSSLRDYVVTFQLGAENPLGVQFPRRTQWKDRCSWTFKGYGCPYTGPLTSCSYTKDGANGCIAHFPAGNLPFKALPGLVRMNL